MNCPHCNKEINIGKIIGSVKSHRKSESARRNGAKGGRPAMKVIKSIQTKSDEALSGAIAPHKCQAAGCSYYDTIQKEVEGCRVWLCENHSTL